MTTCARCGMESPSEARFCANCGAPLEAVAPMEERKTVSVLFADLVGSTSRADQLDPEDVRELLRGYYADLRRELEHFGGTVEKFIGDAVVALFGAPVAHEDDPERAVRAALAIRDRIARANDEAPGRELHVRVAVCTGEALISVGARTSEGEATAAGDVMNTAARLQSAAPVDGVLVDETTHRATTRTITYADHAPVEAKGKAEPIAVYEALEATSRFGLDLGGPARGPLVGRQEEVALLNGALRRAREDRATQFVTLVGVPGMGKSRLVWELYGAVDAEEALISWRQGRSLPYGEGVAYWALAEMVKAQAGILENDGVAVAAGKLSAAVTDVLSGEEAEWVERHLRPLVGLTVTTTGSPESRTEAFAAWRRYLEALALDRPLVLVFEDLHWADDGLLDFVESLADRIAGVSLLVVGTARPELLERRPGWGGGTRNTFTVSLGALTDVEIAELIGSISTHRLLDAAQQEVLLRRAGGNPLYAEEYVRVVEASGVADADVPESIHGIIAARIDGLSAPEKSLLHDAAVLGKVFWSDGLAALGDGSAWEQEEVLHALQRKEFVRREARSTVAGVQQYAFLHALVRDVAYGQLRRGDRIDRHLRAAGWIESLGAERSEDRAEMLVHHYVAALDLARAVGRDTSALAPRVVSALTEAGARAEALGAHVTAGSHYRAALALIDPADDRDPDLLLRLARVSVGREHADEYAEEAIAGFERRGQAERAAEAAAVVLMCLWARGADTTEMIERANAIAAPLPDCREKARVFLQTARWHWLSGRPQEALELIETTTSMAARAGLGTQFDVEALLLKASVRVGAGDVGGIGDIEVALGQTLEHSLTFEAGRAYVNLSSFSADLGEVTRGAEYAERGLEMAERFGLGDPRFLMAELATRRFDQGRWAEALEMVEAYFATDPSPYYQDVVARLVRGMIRYAQGALEEGREDVAWVVERSREMKEPQALRPGLAFAAYVAASDGRLNDAGGLVDELAAEMSENVPLEPTGPWCVAFALAADALGRAAELTALPFGSIPTRWLDALDALAAGEHAQAADILAEAPSRPLEAEARLRAAAELARQGRHAEADAQLERVLSFSVGVGAAGLGARAEALLRRAS